MKRAIRKALTPPFSKSASGIAFNVFQISFWKNFRDDTRGVLAIYVVLTLTLFLGTGILAVDFGRLTVLRTQMQNAADAAATAAAARLIPTSVN